MGLGPMVCTQCGLYAKVHEELECYRCPRCNGHVLDYLWMFTDEDRKRIDKNSRFYKFVAGTE